jgi:hypothetical protein
MKFKELLLIALVCANVTLGAVALTLYISKANIEPAAMATSDTRAGDYVMVTGPFMSGREGVLVIDVVAKRANLYTPKAANGPWLLTSTRDLAADFKK